MEEVNVNMQSHNKVRNNPSLPQPADWVSPGETPFDLEDPLLELKGVSKVYPESDGSRLVLDDVNLRVTKGEFVALVGSSGSGKSTLLRLILGQEEPTSGQLLLDGKPLGYPDTSRGIVPQQYGLFPNLTVLENIMLGDRLECWFLRWRRDYAERRNRAEDYLQTADLFGYKDAYPNHLSGGQQQRAAVLQALIRNPKILLMDEPFGALDPGTRERMQVFLLDLWEKMGITIFFVTHDLEEAVFLGTRVIVLSQCHIDDRQGLARRGSRIVCDIQVGIKGQAASTESKKNPIFTEIIEYIRDMGFEPDHLHHVQDFDLRHSSQKAFTKLWRC